MKPTSCDTIKPMKASPERQEILAKARAALVLKKHRRWAAEMRAAGWTVEEPSDDH